MLKFFGMNKSEPSEPRACFINPNYLLLMTKGRNENYIHLAQASGHALRLEPSELQKIESNKDFIEVKVTKCSINGSNGHEITKMERVWLYRGSISCIMNDRNVIVEIAGDDTTHIFQLDKESGARLVEWVDDQ